MSTIVPRRSRRQRGATRMPSLIASMLPASTAWIIAVSAPSSLIVAKANGRSRGCCSVGSGTHVQFVTVPVGPTSTKSGASSSPFSGFHSSGGASTLPSQRIPRILRCTSPVMNAPNTGPSDRLYGNWMRFSTSRATEPPPGVARRSLGRLARRRA
jgi:hypothetical protein